MKLEDIGDLFVDMLNAVITHPRIEREVVFVLDGITCAALCVLPRYGIALAVAYFLLKDSIPPLRFCKNLYGLQVVNAETGEVASKRLSFLRNFLLLIPGLNLVDVLRFLYSGRRLTDEMLGTDVWSKDRQENNQQAPPEEKRKTIVKAAQSEPSEEDKRAEEEYDSMVLLNDEEVSAPQKEPESEEGDDDGDENSGPTLLFETR